MGRGEWFTELLFTLLASLYLCIITLSEKQRYQKRRLSMTLPHFSFLSRKRTAAAYKKSLWGASSGCKMITLSPRSRRYDAQENSLRKDPFPAVANRLGRCKEGKLPLASYEAVRTLRLCDARIVGPEIDAVNKIRTFDSVQVCHGTVVMSSPLRRKKRWTTGEPIACIDCMRLALRMVTIFKT